MDRPRRFQEAERSKRREQKGTRWYRREARGAMKKEGVFIIPPTPGSVLARKLRKVCQDELKGTEISIGVTERGGRRLGQELYQGGAGESTAKESSFQSIGPLGRCFL